MMKRNGYHWFFVLVVVVALTGTAVGAQKRPTTVAEIALYTGADRQQILEEGAKKEGKLFFYTTGVMAGSLGPFLELFKKKYPYVQVEQWRAGSSEVDAKIMEEYRAGKHVVDIVDGTQLHLMLREQGILQPFSSPNLASIDEAGITKAPGGGAFSAVFRFSGIGWAYNTKLMSREELPKTYQDLLDPRWKGRMALPGENTPVNWMGTLLRTYGEDFVKRMAQQNFSIHTMSARALLDLIIAGEYTCSPVIYDSHVLSSRAKGAPVDWAPLEPVLAPITQMALPKYSSRPNAAMLFIDLRYSKEAGEIEKAYGYISTRKDIPVGKPYKKFYGAESTEELIKWQHMYNTVFLRR